MRSLCTPSAVHAWCPQLFLLHHCILTAAVSTSLQATASCLPAPLHLVLLCRHLLIGNAFASCCAATCCLLVPLPLSLVMSLPLIEPLIYSAGCCIASYLPAPPLAKPLLFGWLVRHLTSAGSISCWACHVRLVVALPPFIQHLHLLSSCRVLLHICLLLHPSHLSGCHIASHLLAPLLIEPLSFVALPPVRRHLSLHRLPSATTSTSYQDLPLCTKPFSLEMQHNEKRKRSMLIQLKKGEAMRVEKVVC